MKTAIYIENGDTQIVLTPENAFEKAAIKSIEQGKKDVRVLTGGFYECQGGYHRQGRGDDSLMIRVESCE